MKQVNLQPVGLWQLVAYFFRLGAFGFGGPIALAGYMQRDLVPRKWITEEEYVQGLAFSQMMPGPLAAQLAMWIGYIRHGALGASLVGIVFILPTYLIVLFISILYMAYHGLSLVQALFYGIGPVVIAIVAISAVRLAKTTVGKDWKMWVVFVATALITLITRAEIAMLFLAAGLLGIFLYSRHTQQKTGAGLMAAPLPAGIGVSLPILIPLGAFFLKAGAFTFGSGLAIVPFLHQGVVVEHQWLNEREFLDAVAIGIITPGPVVITAAFVGYLVAGFWGSIVAASGVFLPVYLFVLFIGKYIIRYREHSALRGFVKGATSAASGAIAGATFILGQGSIVDIPTAVIAAVSLLILWRFKIPEPAIIAVAAIVGIILYHRH